MRCRNGVTLQEEVCAASLEPRYYGRKGGGERSQMKMGGGRENDYRNMIVKTEMLALHFERAQRRKIKLDEAWPSWRWLVDEMVCIQKMYGLVSSRISKQYGEGFVAVGGSKSFGEVQLLPLGNRQLFPCAVNVLPTAFLTEIPELLFG